jgi:hypothetical protein
MAIDGTGENVIRRRGDRARLTSAQGLLFFVR